MKGKNRSKSPIVCMNGLIRQTAMGLFAKWMYPSKCLSLYGGIQVGYNMFINNSGNGKIDLWRLFIMNIN